MQIKFLKLIVENLVNKPAIPIIDLLVGKKDVNEFLIAKKLNLTINQTRNILYKLSDYGLVSFTRKKDKKKGWYIYFWTLNIYQSLDLLDIKLRGELEQLENQLNERKQGRYYVCSTCSLEVTEEAALVEDFICQECEQVYQLADNREIIAKIEKEIFRLKKEIELINEEKNKERDKFEKKKIKKLKKDDSDKKETRKKNLEEKKRIAEKTKQETQKKEKSKKQAIKKIKKPIKKEKKKKKISKVKKKK
jgi:transcription factor E